MPQPRLVTAVLARNEAGPDRYLTRVLERCQQFSDAVVVLDDRSTDGTAKLCRDAGCEVKVRSALDARAWGNEAAARSELWGLACGRAPGRDDWILFCDADMELRGDVRGLTLTRELNAWAFPLYDLWSDTVYRSDQYWRGHETPRVWMVAPNRVPRGWAPTWNARGVHCGHIPENFPVMAAVAPPDCYWLHWAYAKPEHRQAKYEQYVAQGHQLSPAERAHVESILVS